MAMAAHRRKRILIHAAVFFGILLLASAGVMSGLIRVDACHFCGGQGSLYCDVEGIRHPCGACASGIESRLPRFLASVEALLDWIVPILWCVLCVGAAAVLVGRLRIVQCRTCEGSGRLALEVLPPGEAAFSVETDCVACEGRGRLGVLRGN